MLVTSSTSCTVTAPILLTTARRSAGEYQNFLTNGIKKTELLNIPLDFSISQHQFQFAFVYLPSQLIEGHVQLKDGRNRENKTEVITQIQSHSCRTLFLLLDLPGLNFFSVCLVWISMRSSSPASALSRLFWLCFLVPVGARLPTTSFGLGPFFFPGGRPEFWDAVRGALESGEPGNGGPARPMFCWKMSCQRICVHFSWTV